VALEAKFEHKYAEILRDARPWSRRFVDGAKDPAIAAMAFATTGILIWHDPLTALFGDLIFVIMSFYFVWLIRLPVSLPFKLPKSARRIDPNFARPDGSKGMADGILYLGNNAKTGEEMWFTNTDARTHCLYLGTTGSGKTFGLKSFACNALCWSSGFVYIDGKADTDLWSTISAHARRFGRDDDLLVMNYMTGGIGGRVPSNTINPFSSGSASYLTNMMVSLMPEAEGDNAMWKDRAVALISAIMPCLVYKRDNQNLPLNIAVVRTYLVFKEVIRLSRDSSVPERFRSSLKGYLNELPGYVDSVFDDDGNEKPGPDGSAADTSTPRQQHGYLSMQFTRSLSSLGDDYGFIFDTQAADIDMLDVVLNRRILVVLIPALEKSGDEIANLGKIISSTLKGMMGQTLGSAVEGDVGTVIENKVTTSATPFMAIFDEVGYYVAQGMAVMAAQARSLGFSLVFAAQDMAAMEKRVKEEARSITANCNIKIFGKLEDPTQTKEYFEKTVGQAIVTEVSGFERSKGMTQGYLGSQNASVQVRARASYDQLKSFVEGRAICCFGRVIQEMQIYNSDIGHAKSMRVQRFLPVPPPSEEALKGLRQVDDVVKRLRNPKWDAAAVATPRNPDITALADGFAQGREAGENLVACGILGVTAVADAHGAIKPGGAGAAPMLEASVSSPLPPLENMAERAAAEAVARMTNTGPLSWTELLGAGDATPLGAAPPPVRAGEEKAASEIPGGPISWMDVLGASPVAAAQEKKKAEDDSGGEDEGTGGKSDGGPIGWGDIIGGDKT